MRTRILILIAILASTSAALAQLESRPITQSEEEVVYEYDKTHNIKFHEKPGEYSQYIGEEIFLYPRNSDSTSDIMYYGNFELLVPNPTNKSTAYKGKYVKDKKVVSKRPWLDTSTGYYTPYNEVEGHIFEIINIEPTDGYIFLTLKSEENTLIKWKVTAPDKFLADSYIWPCIIVSYYEELENEYVGNSYTLNSAINWAQSINNNGELEYINAKTLKCIDMNLIEDKSGYQVPKLIFEDDNLSTWAISIADTPELNSYLRNDYSYKTGYSLYFTLDELTLVKVKEKKPNRLLNYQKKVFKTIFSQ